MKAGLPRVRVTASAYAQIARELWRVYPREGFVVPLLALRPRKPALPGPALQLEDLEEVVLAEVVCVPAHLQRNESLRVHALSFADAAIAPEIDARLARHPLLRACGFLHSHPFARGSTAPSHTDRVGHLRPQLAQNREAGLAASFSIIACLGGAEAQPLWKLQCFALDGDGAQHDLGFAEVVPDGSREASWALQGDWESSTAGRVASRWLAKARAQGLEPRRDELFDGWLRLKLPASERATLLALVRREFPSIAPRLVAWDRWSGRTFELALPEPGWFRADFLVRAVSRLQEVLPCPTTSRA